MKQIQTIISTLFIIILTGIFFVPSSVTTGNVTLCIPDSGTFWIGVHPPVQNHTSEMDLNDESIRSFSDAIGKKPAIITFSHEWSINRSFPEKQCNFIHSTGAIPWVRLMLRSDIRQYRPEYFYTLSRIATGYFDKDLRSW